jgi:Tol biopolymer transport system component
VRLRPYEAATIAREVALQVVRGQIAGVPSPHVVRLAGNGSVSVEGPVAAGGRPVIRLAQLLDALLPDSDQDGGSEFRVPGGLKLVVARALGTLDLPPFGSLEAFVEALDRFAATDPVAAITNLAVATAESTAVRPPEQAATAPPVAAQVQPFAIAQVQPFTAQRATEARPQTRESDARPQTPRELLTISDIRRARRATGVPLVKVAQRSRIPIGLLRQLEWGYFFNWPRGRYGRTQLVRYARAAGLDEELVLSTVTPLIDCADAPSALPQPLAQPPAEAAALVPRPTAELDLRPPREVEVQVSPAATLLVPVEAIEVRPRRRRGRLIAALAAAAAVTIVAPMWWDYPGQRTVPNPPASQVAAGTTGTNPASPVARPDGPRDTTDVATMDPASPAGAASLPSGPKTGVPAGQREGASGRTPTAVPAEYQQASEQEFSPSFASVGTAMFYHADDAKGTALVRADSDGDGSVLRITRIVDDSANNYHVRPSPDGARIAFDSDRDGVRGVYVADGDGQHVRRVSGEGYAAVPSWSPDGKTLAFVRAEPDRPKVWNLWTLQLESGEMRQITRRAYGQPWGGSWFPDGRRIAYSHEDRLIVHDLETGTERVFPTPIKGRLVRTPAVSPDGRRIVFQVHRDGAWLLEYPAGTVRKVLEDPTAEEYTWAPDGKRLAYHSRRSGNWGVWVMASR